MNKQSNLSGSLIFPLGAPADNDHFIGQAWAETLVRADDPLNCPAWNVTFAPGARNNWHIHPGGQLLLVTGGRGNYQADGQPAREIKAGDVVSIPAGVKHWHGAAANSWLIHLAICPNPIHGGAIWLEPVAEADYRQLT